MASDRRLRHRANRAAGRAAAAVAAKVAARTCPRCGGGVRTDKWPYGRICAVCADELDRYYTFVLGMVGDSVQRLYARDVWLGQVPDLGASARRAGRAMTS